MKKLSATLLGVVAAVLIALTSTSASADGYQQYGGTKGYPRAFSWTGFYIGLNAGLATGQTTADLGLPIGLFDTDYDLNGGVFGGQIGFNWQAGKTVFGIEATYSSSSVQGNSACFLVLECKRDVESIGTVVGRLGLAMDRSLLYVLGGVAWAEVTSQVSFIGINLVSESNTHMGWTAGIGLEHALTNNLTFKIEYSHIDLGTEQYFGIADIDVKMDIVRLGVNLKLN
jgi:outer membrane immunogenic protein